MTKKFEPPKCPYCGEPLFSVREIDYSLYEFDEKTGLYNNENHFGELETRCPKCGGDLFEIFEEGVCNYRPTRK